MNVVPKGRKFAIGQKQGNTPMEFDSTRVLVVEDDDDAAEEMAEALSSAGYPVTRVAEIGRAHV